MNHNSFVVFRNGIESLLDHMTPKWVHRQGECASSNGFCNLYHLLWGAVLEASLHQEVSETVDHQRISLGNNRLDDFVLLVRSPNLKLLLEEDRSLLIVAAYDLVNDILPIAVDIAV